MTKDDDHDGGELSYKACKTPVSTDNKAKFQSIDNPLRNASLLSKMTGHWLQPLISLGATRPLEDDDVWQMCYEDTCSDLVPRFNESWKSSSSSLKNVLTRFTVALWKTFKFDFITQAAMFWTYTIITAVQPFFVESILEEIEDKDINDRTLGITNGYVLVSILCVSSFVAVTCLNYGFYVGSKIGVNIRSIAMNAVYEKALRLSAHARSKSTTGEIVTLMSVDSERLFEACVMSQWAWIAPITMVIAMVLIGFVMGPIPALVGAVVNVAIIVFSFYLGSLVGKMRSELIQITEERVKVTSEVLQGIRVMKYYAWEASMVAKVEAIRASELVVLRKFHLLRVFNSTLLFLTPIILTGTILGVYISIDGNELDVALVFTLITFINISRFSVAILPVAVSALSEALISLQRTDTYLHYDELQKSTDDKTTMAVIIDDAESNIVFKDAVLTWTGEQENLVSIENSKEITRTHSSELNINLEISPKSLVMIVGAVGSGKSSLVQGILGEMRVAAGNVSVNGRVSYVSQEPWIRNDTVMNNIIFESPFDSVWYRKVLAASQLLPDLAILSNGDQTEIGESGINLSGGQKARISLARAIYRKKTSNILLMDDPLSAVDVHVARALFNECIQTLAADKIRVLVLNSHYHFLSSADRILVMDNGRIVADGTYDDIVSSFPEYATNNINVSVDDVQVDDEEEEKQQDEEKEPATSAAALMDVEDRVRGAVSNSVYITYFANVGGNGFVIFTFVLLAFALGQFLRVSVDWYTGEWAKGEEDKVKGTSSATFSDWSTEKYGMYLLLLIIVTSVVIIGRAFMFIALTLQSSKNLHRKLFKRVLRAPINTFYDVTPIGRILNRFARDFDLVDTILPDFFLMFITFAFVGISVFIVCAFASVWILLTYIPMILIFFYVKTYFEKSSRELKRLEGVTRTPIFSSFGETLNGLSTIRAYAMQESFAAKNRESVDNNSRFFFGFWAAGRWLSIRLDWLSAVLTTVVSFALIITKGSVEPAVAGLTLVYSLMLTSVLQWTVRVANMTENTMTAVERLLHYSEIDTEAPELCPNVDPSKSVWPSKGAIEFKDLKLRYRPGLDLVLKGISLSITGGSKVGICGRTGAGKSSMIVALFRISEIEKNNGTIEIDGVDISKIGLETLRSSLSIIPQDPVVFSGTLRENLDPFNVASDEEIWSAVKRVHLEEFVKTKELGISFVVSEKGDNLSVGQRQLLCIGRALLRKSKVIVMDEATANVDLVTDKLIQTTIREAFKNETVLTIAHRLDTILDSDRIVVLDDGLLVEYDTPKELLKKPDGVFRSLASDAGLLGPEDKNV